MDDLSSTGGAQAGFASLTQRMRERTADLHKRAEHSGVVAAILSSTVSRRAYALYLRNLLPAYEAMELGLARHRGQPGIGDVARETPDRAACIRRDLTALEGSEWRSALPLLPVGERYGVRVSAAADAPNGDLLLAHAYTRGLGDLNGGRILRRCLLRRFGEDFPAVAFTAFPDIADVPAFTKSYRATLDEAGKWATNADAVVLESEAAFVLNIAVSEDAASFPRT